MNHLSIVFERAVAFKDFGLNGCCYSALLHTYSVVVVGLLTHFAPGVILAIALLNYGVQFHILLAKSVDFLHLSFVGHFALHFLFFLRMRILFFFVVLGVVYVRERL